MKKISVLMGVYNCENTLAQAIISIKNQTYPCWELILCDDGSSDCTYKVAQTFALEDSRIILLQNPKNLGLNATLNRCLAEATGEYIARMDGDDDCVPERFEKQLTFLENHPQFDIVSSAMILFDENGEWGITKEIAMPSVEQVVTGVPIRHAAVMMRKSCLDAVGGYTESPRMLRVEDVDLWIKLYASGCRCFNFSEPLYRMRNDQQAIARRKYRYRINSTYVRLRGCKLLHLSPKCYLKAFLPMVIGLVPGQIRQFIRKKQRGIKND